jgi:hypothetical protein
MSEVTEIKLLVLMVFLAGCATAAVQSPEVAPLQALADSIQSGYPIKTGRADRGYLGTMIGALVSGPARWLNAGNPCAGCPTDMYPTIYLRDEVVGTNCGEVIVVSRFARRKTHIPITFGQREVDKQTRELLSERGWTDDQINSAWKSCPSSIVSD